MSIACKWYGQLAGWLPREENNWSLVSISGTAVTNTEKLYLHSGAWEPRVRDKGKMAEKDGHLS
jgi:hypothetical protein